MCAQVVCAGVCAWETHCSPVCHRKVEQSNHCTWRSIAALGSWCQTWWPCILEGNKKQAQSSRTEIQNEWEHCSRVDQPSTKTSRSVLPHVKLPPPPSTGGAFKAMCCHHRRRLDNRVPHISTTVKSTTLNCPFISVCLSPPSPCGNKCFNVGGRDAPVRPM